MASVDSPRWWVDWVVLGCSIWLKNYFICFYAFHFTFKTHSIQSNHSLSLTNADESRGDWWVSGFWLYAYFPICIWGVGWGECGNGKLRLRFTSFDVGLYRLLYVCGILLSSLNINSSYSLSHFPIPITTHPTLVFAMYVRHPSDWKYVSYNGISV